MQAPEEVEAAEDVTVTTAEERRAVEMVLSGTGSHCPLPP